MKGCIKVLKDQPPNSVEGLLNALRWVGRTWGRGRCEKVPPSEGSPKGGRARYVGDAKVSFGLLVTLLQVLAAVFL